MPKTIYYFCPDITVKSGGIRRIYRHIEILVQHGFSAAVLHEKSGFAIPDMPIVPICYSGSKNLFHQDDVIVIPEGFPGVMKSLKNMPLRRFVIALNWSYIYNFLPDDEDWRDYGIERVITVSPFIKDFIEWSMDLPVNLVDSSIDPKLYYYKAEEKALQITFFHRKSIDLINPLKRIMRSKDSTFVSKIKWRGLNDLPLDRYAMEIRKSMTP